MPWLLFPAILLLAAVDLAAAGHSPNRSSRGRSVFIPEPVARRIRRNVERASWAKEECDRIVEAVRPWSKLTEDELWNLVFGPGITRSWMVWSNGHCPSCRASVPMYNWRIDALGDPWKTRCPHCGDRFPTNDFGAYYRSGLDGRGWFDPSRADRSLLHHADHPDAGDPLRSFGVDDGEGFAHDGHRWRFIGAYLIYGQWKQAVLGGIAALSRAYVVSGDREFARRAAILLDRVADVYPAFDFQSQGLVYERALGSHGYVSVWHDASEETRDMAFAYDAIRPGIEGDEELVRFLSQKARRHGLANTKASIADIYRNIEDGLLRDPLTNLRKITTNEPRTDFTRAVLHSVLDEPDSSKETSEILDRLLESATAIDGTTGEKGLTGYSAYAIQAVAEILARFSRVTPGFLRDAFRRHPALRSLFRFHLDLWHYPSYLPTIGDGGSFARPSGYCGIQFGKAPRIEPSIAALLWEVYRQTRDPAFAQLIYHLNGDSVDGLPYDLAVSDPDRVQDGVKRIIERYGKEPRLTSVDKPAWRVSMLRGGQGRNRRSLWLDYDSGGRHGHADAMNLGLFAFGLDLLPDFGYPPVNFGGWDSPRAQWYIGTTAHNTVVIDGKNQPAGMTGTTTMWADGRRFRVFGAASGSDQGDAKGYADRYDRLVAMIDLSDDFFYLFDLFDVSGGREHVRLMHGSFGQVVTDGLALAPSPPLFPTEQMRDYRIDSHPRPGWSADWTVEDRYRLRPGGVPVHMRLTDLTEGAEGGITEQWVLTALFNSNEDAWIPCVFTRRRSDTTVLTSTFVSILEPYEEASRIRTIRRLESVTNGLAVEVCLADGRRDLLLRRMGSGTAPLTVSGEKIILDGALGWARLTASGELVEAAVCDGKSLRVGDRIVRTRSGRSFGERRFTPR